MSSTTPNSEIPEKRYVVFAHGILMNRWTLYPLERHLRARGHVTFNPTYPSRSYRIEELAAWLAPLVRDFIRDAGAPRVDFVTHSMGGLLVRRLLTEFDFPEASRIVQIVPPNAGSQVARFFRDWRFYRWLYGVAGQQLAWSAPRLHRMLGVPESVEIGVIGARLRGMPPLLPVRGPSDGTVAIEEMPLEGARFRLLSSGHNAVLLSRGMWREVATFLETGHFSQDDRERVEGLAPH